MDVVAVGEGLGGSQFFLSLGPRTEDVWTTQIRIVEPAVPVMALQRGGRELARRGFLWADMSACSSLETLYAPACRLQGPLPASWPASLRAMGIDGNPDLWGVIGKDMIMQCNTI